MTEIAGKPIPTLSEWLGGHERLGALFDAFYERVRQDDVLAPAFAHMDQKHAQHVAAFVDEAFGGPKAYTSGGGSHAQMIRRHMGRHLTHEQRRRWVALLIETADQVGLPDDPEFRAALVGYLEWGSRLAVLNSADGAAERAPNLPMPEWNWGPPGGPWRE
jgi:hemoglobin